MAIDAGERLTIIGGVHVGCFELFAHEGIRSIRDLKGKKVGVQGLGLAPHVFVTSMAAYVGLNPALRRAAGRSVLAHLIDLSQRDIVASDGPPTVDAHYRLRHLSSRGTPSPSSG